jgi:tetratricopeptide (TPR) repeat protein
MNQPLAQTRRVLGVGLPAVLLAMALPPAAARSQDAMLGEGVTRERMSTSEMEAKAARLEKQAAAEPTNYRVFYELGNLYADMGKVAEARRSYETAIRINPKYIEAMVNLGSLLSDEQAHEEAILYLEQALAVNPEDCKARSNLGNVYYAMGRYPDAMFEYERAVELDSRCYSALYNIGVAFADAGLFREAVKWWSKVVTVAPGTDAARSAQENIQLLDRFVPLPPPRK